MDSRYLVRSNGSKYGKRGEVASKLARTVQRCTTGEIGCSGRSSTQIDDWRLRELSRVPNARSVRRVVDWCQTARRTLGKPDPPGLMVASIVGGRQRIDPTPVI